MNPPNSNTNGTHGMRTVRRSPSVNFTDWLSRGEGLQRRRDDSAGIRSIIDEAHSRRLEGAPDRRHFLRLNIPLLVLQAEDRPVADASRLRRLVERPLQRRPSHPALSGRERVGGQNYPP